MRKIAPFFLAFSCAGGPGVRELPRGAAPELALQFTDEVPFHNVGIAFDGKRYYTVNGGNNDYGRVNVYDTTGKFLKAYKIKIDARAIWYHPRLKRLFIKDYFRDLWEFDPKTGRVKLFAESAFHDCQSSPALSPDGKLVYERVDTLVFVMEWGSFQDAETLKIKDGAEFPASVCIAAGPGALFTFDGEKLRVWSLKGEPLGSYSLPKGDYPFSLSWAGGKLFIASDADGEEVGAEGVWYGYEFR